MAIREIHCEWGKFDIIGGDERIHCHLIYKLISNGNKIHVRKQGSDWQGYLTLSPNDHWMLFEEE